MLCRSGSRRLFVAFPRGAVGEAGAGGIGGGSELEQGEDDLTVGVERIGFAAFFVEENAKEMSAGAFSDENVDVEWLTGFEVEPVAINGTSVGGDAGAGILFFPTEARESGVGEVAHEHDFSVDGDDKDVVATADEAVGAVRGRGDLPFVVDYPILWLDNVADAEGFGRGVGFHHFGVELCGVERGGGAEVPVEDGFVEAGDEEFVDGVCVGAVGFGDGLALLGLFEVVEDADERGCAGRGAAGGAEGGGLLWRGFGGKWCQGGKKEVE